MIRNSSALVSTSTPRVGSSSSSTRHRRSSQRASTTFCWLPPESSRAERVPSCGRDAQAAELGLRGGALGLHADEAALEAGDVGQRDVLGEVPLEQQRLRLAVLGGEPEPGGDRRSGRPGGRRTPSTSTSPASRRSTP